jgi:hypothetical protein
MSALVKFASDDEHHRALDILIDIDEGYEGASHHRIIVSNRAAAILRRRGIQFNVFGKRTSPARKNQHRTITIIN